MARKKKLKLTVWEKSLLEHPPTEKTWICTARKTDDEVVIKHVNAGNSGKCVYCATKRPANPKLLWPDYVSACEKVGIEPGYMWRQPEIGNPIMRLKGEKWMTAPEV